MGTNYKVPNQASSGAETFSDALVGLQITNGSNQLTNTNFNIDRTIPEKDDKDFRIEPFSDFLTLDDLNQEVYSGITTTYSNGNVTDNRVKFKRSKENGNVSLFGSLKEKIRVSVIDIIKKFPAGIYVDVNKIEKNNDYSAFNISYNEYTKTTEFYLPKSMFYNPFGVEFLTPSSKIIPDTFNGMLNFYSSYTKYVIDVNDVTYPIVDYVEPDSDNYVKLTVNGKCFDGYTNYSLSYLIRPNNGYVEEFYASLNDIESILLNRETTPIYTSKFNVPNDDGTLSTESTTWPLSYDGWNISTNGLAYNIYIEDLNNISTIIDEYKSNLIVRFLVSPQIFEFDTEDKKIESIFQIYGQSFDEIKKYIDNIKYMRNISYDGVNNVPDIFLKQLAENLGLSTTTLYNETTLQELTYDRSILNYDGVSVGLNVAESETEIYRRLVNNLVYLYKSKGTRSAIEFIMKFIGAPDPMIVINEYVYKTDGVLNTTNIEDDINLAISGTKYTNIAVLNDTNFSYDVVKLTGKTELTRSEYPVDETTGLPRKIESTNGNMFFEKGAGWYKKTLEHRSEEILDLKRSDLTSRIKTIKTKSKPFTHGEEYFDNFRKLPGLKYGYNLTSIIDNKKSTNLSTNSDIILNRKNIDIFLSLSNVIDYDIYRKINDINTFSVVLTLDGFELITKTNNYIEIINNSGNTETISFNNYTFDDYKKVLLSSLVKNSNVVKYSKSYNNMTEIYFNYLKYFDSYNYPNILEYINKLSTNWVDIVEQFIPATTLWCGGNLIDNNSLNRAKYQHKKTNNVDYMLNDYYITTSQGVLTDGGVSLLNGDDDMATISLPFSFKFYDNTYNTVYVSTNGYISFNNLLSYERENFPTQNIQNAICGLWLDLNNTVNGTITENVIGAAPNRTFIIRYDVPRYDNQSNITEHFEIRLFETSNNIELVYGDITSGTFGSTVGIQEGFGEYKYEQYDNTKITNGLVIRYTHL